LSVSIVRFVHSARLKSLASCDTHMVRYPGCDPTFTVMRVPN
jgi:hypothetical protein